MPKLGKALPALPSCVNNNKYGEKKTSDSNGGGFCVSNAEDGKGNWEWDGNGARGRREQRLASITPSLVEELGKDERYEYVTESAPATATGRGRDGVWSTWESDSEDEEGEGDANEEKDTTITGGGGREEEEDGGSDVVPKSAGVMPIRAGTVNVVNVSGGVRHSSIQKWHAVSHHHQNHHYEQTHLISPPNGAPPHQQQQQTTYTGLVTLLPFGVYIPLHTSTPPLAVDQSLLYHVVPAPISHQNPQQSRHIFTPLLADTGPTPVSGYFIFDPTSRAFIAEHGGSGGVDGVTLNRNNTVTSDTTTATSDQTTSTFVRRNSTPHRTVIDRVDSAGGSGGGGVPPASTVLVHGVPEPKPPLTV